MADVDAIVVAGAIYGVINIVGLYRPLNSRRKLRRSQWVRAWILQRPVSGAYNKLFSYLLNTDEVSFQNFIRMDLAEFEDLLH